MSKYRRICLYGGPGVGKTALSGYLIYRMKTDGYNVGLVHEVVKARTYINLHPRPEDQYKIFGDQINTVMLPLNGGEDYIVSDSPMMLNTLYAEMIGTPGWEYMRKMISELDKLYPPLNIFLKRNLEWDYRQIGRFSSEEEAKEIDALTWKMFKDEGIEVYEFVSGDNENIYNFIKGELSKNSE